jgi:ubiquinone/menaquinone biosynthesis C-methylase UbiE
MRMTGLEKRLVNASGHTGQVVASAEKLLLRVPFRTVQTYLDVGCGNGAVALWMAQAYGWQVTGVDFDPDQIALAQQASLGVDHAQFMTGDATDLPFEDGAFDMVSSFRMTHHIPDWRAALVELLRVTRPGGYLAYVDLVFPAAVASLGKAVLNRWMGFPTRDEIDGFIQQNRLTVIYQSNSFPHEVICQKP